MNFYKLWENMQPEKVEVTVDTRTGRFQLFINKKEIKDGYAYISRHENGRWTLDSIDVPEELQKRGYGTAIMRKIAEYLRSVGAVTLSSSNEGSGTVQMLDKVFGRKNVTHKHGGQKISFTTAKHIMDVDYGYTGSEVNLKKAFKN